MPYVAWSPTARCGSSPTNSPALPPKPNATGNSASRPNATLAATTHDATGQHAAHEHRQHLASAGRSQQPRNPKHRRSGRLSAVRRTLEDVTPDTATLIRDGLALDVDQRAVVAHALLESLHDAGDTGEVDAAWRAEATRRLAEVREGAVELVDADEHYERLRASLTA